MLCMCDFLPGVGSRDRDRDRGWDRAGGKEVPDARS